MCAWAAHLFQFSSRQCLRCDLLLQYYALFFINILKRGLPRLNHLFTLVVGWDDVRASGDDDKARFMPSTGELQTRPSGVSKQGWQGTGSFSSYFFSLFFFLISCERSLQRDKNGNFIWLSHKMVICGLNEWVNNAEYCNAFLVSAKYWILTGLKGDIDWETKF